MILAALRTVLRLTSVLRFLMMIAIEVFAVALDIPDVDSHILLLLVGGVCLLSWVAWVAMRTQRLPDAGILFEAIANLSAASAHTRCAFSRPSRAA